MKAKLLTIGIFVTLGVNPAVGREVAVIDSAGLRRALESGRAGDEIVLTGREYGGGIFVERLEGREDAPISVRGKDPAAPPLIRGGEGSGIHLSGCRFVELRDLRVDGFATNGINIDDASKKAQPALGMVLENVEITSTGPRGNHDALKLSGVDRFVVRGCRFVGWGGSAIDMVGCHDGVIEGCYFEGKEGFSQNNGVQAKGGSARVRVLGNFFKDAGQRGVNIGGSTGHQFFRPELGDFEAKDIEVAGNRFVGSLAPVAWVSCDGGHVHHNTIYHPEKWVMRILQESTGDPFKPAHGGVFENNVVVYDRRVSVIANVGGGTAPETFVFRSNVWFQSGAEERPRAPELPTKETGGVVGKDPELEDAGEETMRVGTTESAFRGMGADGWRR